MRGPFSTPITPLPGSFFHADPHDKPKRQRFKRYPIGFFHIDIAEVQTAEGKLYLFVGIDRYPPSSRSRSWSTRLIAGQHGSSSNTC
jgi:hypothetical protein